MVRVTTKFGNVNKGEVGRGEGGRRHRKPKVEFTVVGSPEKVLVSSGWGGVRENSIVRQRKRHRMYNTGFY